MARSRQPGNHQRIGIMPGGVEHHFKNPFDMPVNRYKSAQIETQPAGGCISWFSDISLKYYAAYSPHNQEQYPHLLRLISLLFTAPVGPECRRSHEKRARLPGRLQKRRDNLILFSDPSVSGQQGDRFNMRGLRKHVERLNYFKMISFIYKNFDIPGLGLGIA